MGIQRETIVLVATTIMLLGPGFGLLTPNAVPNYIPTAYSQSQVFSFQAEVKALDDKPARKVKVGDITIAYKQLGNNTEKPIVLINGARSTMDMWNPTILKELSSSSTVIIFDNRGAGETTAGTKQFSINQFAIDTAHLLDALKIENVDILGHSMGSFIAQELALKDPNRINSLILSGSSCGGKEAIPPSPKALKVLEAITNTSSLSQEEFDKITSTLFSPDWFKANPNYQNYIPFPKESVSAEIGQKQSEAIAKWLAKGTCDYLSNITQPTLVIVGTDDMWAPAANSLMIVENIPAAWLVQIRDAGHALMDQYPDRFSKVVSTFLDLT